MTNGSLMKVESIAESFCNTFDLHLVIIHLEYLFFVFFWVAAKDRFYCTGMVTEPLNCLEQHMFFSDCKIYQRCEQLLFDFLLVSFSINSGLWSTMQVLQTFGDLNAL